MATRLAYSYVVSKPVNCVDVFRPILYCSPLLPKVSLANMTPATRPLRIGFTIFPNAMSLDFIGPLDILSTLSRDDPARPGSIPHVDCVILGDKLEPVKMSNGMGVMPQMTYAQAATEEWDAVLVPGGIGARPWFDTNAACRDFLIKVVPKCRYVFTGKLNSALTMALGQSRRV